jgi:aminopeptidase-like protein
MVVPETIGSIAFLANHPEVIKFSIGGFFSEMLGTSGPMVGQRTRHKDSYWNSILESALAASGSPYKIVNFMKSASNDEKVLDSPGVDIPTFSITRSPYPEYHTSDDNINLIDIDRLRESRDVLQHIIDLAESDYIPVLNQPGPIFLSGYGLYPNWRDNPELLPIWESFIDVMYSIDGIHSVAELSARHNIPIEHYFYWTNAFAERGLLSKKKYVQTR